MMPSVVVRVSMLRPTKLWPPWWSVMLLLQCLELAMTRMRTLGLAAEATMAWAEQVPTVKCMAHGLLFQTVEPDTVRMVGTGIEADSPVRRATSPMMALGASERPLWSSVKTVAVVAPRPDCAAVAGAVVSAGPKGIGPCDTAATP